MYYTYNIYIFYGINYTHKYAQGILPSSSIIRYQKSCDYHANVPPRSFVNFVLQIFFLWLLLSLNVLIQTLFHKMPNPLYWHLEMNKKIKPFGCQIQRLGLASFKTMLLESFTLKNSRGNIAEIVGYFFDCQSNKGTRNDSRVTVCRYFGSSYHHRIPIPTAPIHTSQPLEQMNLGIRIRENITIARELWLTDSKHFGGFVHSDCL